MAHVTVHRALSTSSTCVCSLETTEADEIDSPTFPKELIKQRSISECYFVVKGAALILPHDECRHVRKKSHSNGACVIQDHLKSMSYLLREEDTLRMAVKLETAHPGRTRYLVVVSYVGSQNTEECCLLGIDCNNQTTIGLVLPVWADTRITLDGDGGFSVSSSGRHHIFKPVSVQAMWSALQTLHKSSAKARGYNYFTGGGTHQWIEYYEKFISSDRSCLNEWHAMDDLESKRPPSPDAVRTTPTEREATEKLIRTKLKEVMMCVDLDEVTSKYIRTSLEEQLDMNLNEYKSFIDQEMLVILGQMDAPTEIFEYLYLGSEWNASNLEELKVKGVDHILNVTREIDNFFPGMFDYLNVRVYDDEATELLKYWDKTYKYIRQVKDRGSKVLVHCKMGISRSASVVVAYVMKAYNWNLAQALDFVKNKRNCIKPNSGFIEQLKIYQGILDASKHRHNSLWRSKSETNLKSSSSNVKQRKGGLMEQKLDPNKRYNLYLSVPGLSQRPKSWSPSDVFFDAFFPKCSTHQHSRGEEAVFEQDFKPLRQRSGTDPSCYLNLELGSVQLDPCRPLPESLPCLNPKPCVPRVSSIKDRINELESQTTLTVVETQRVPKMEPKSPALTSSNKAGLVLNLAHQFEGGSKPSTPSPVEDCAALEDLVCFKNTSFLQGVEPIVSQMKLPALKHQAVLVKPTPWPQSGNGEEETVDTTPNADRSDKPLTDSGLGEEEPLKKSSQTVQDLYSRQSSGTSSQASDPFSWSRQSSCSSSFGVSGSPPIQWFLRDRENDNTCHFYQDDGSSTLKSVCCSDEHPLDARPVQHSLQTLVESQVIHNSELISCADPDQALFTKGGFLYEKEDIPWTPGTVRRTKQKIEEKNLKRTTSYDSGFPGQSQSTPSTPPELSPDSDSGASVIRSQSLRNELRPRSMVFPSRWHPSPQPTNCSPRLQKSWQEDNPFILGMPHSASTPSVVEAVNEVLCGTRVVLNSAIQSLPQYATDGCLDKENSDSFNQTEAPLQKTVMQREPRLALKNTQEKYSKETDEKSSKQEPEVKETLNHSLVSSQGDEGEGSCGVVKRLTKELEAKTGTVAQKKERIVIIGIDGKDVEPGKKSSTVIKRDRNQVTPTSMPPSPSLSKRQQTLFASENAKNSLPLPEKGRTLSDVSDDRTPVSACSPVHHRKTSLDMDRLKKTTLSEKVKDFPFVEHNRVRPVSNGYQGPSFSRNELPAHSAHTSDTISSSCLLRSPTETGKPPTGSKSPFGVFNSPAPQLGTQKKPKKMQQGKTHPLSKLSTKQRHPNPVYNTM